MEGFRIQVPGGFRRFSPFGGLGGFSVVEADADFGLGFCEGMKECLGSVVSVLLGDECDEVFWQLHEGGGLRGFQRVSEV